MPILPSDNGSALLMFIFPNLLKRIPAILTEKTNGLTPEQMNK